MKVYKDNKKPMDWSLLFHQNQMDTGNQIVDYFTSGRGRYALLKADMQSGKTGTYNWVIKQLVNRDHSIHHVNVISGSDEIVLKSQAFQDLQFYHNHHLPNTICGVYFRQDILTRISDIRNSLIVIDESHLDQTKDQTMSQFFSRFGMSLDGNLDILNQLNVYILSVSATPFSEESDILFNKSDTSKKMFYLQPGEGYRGVRYYYEQGLIRRIPKDINDIIPIILSHGNKYNIIRSSSNHKSNKTKELEELCKAYHIHCFWYDSSPKTNIRIDFNENVKGTYHPYIGHRPTGPSVVFIKERLRVGKVLPKDYLATVWEFSKTPKTDTFAQGLLGRCCGYHSFDIEIYCTSYMFHKSKHTYHARDMNEIERLITPGNMPFNATNLVQKRRVILRKNIPPHRQTNEPTVAIKISLNMEKDENDSYVSPHSHDFNTIWENSRKHSKDIDEPRLFIRNIMDMLTENNNCLIRSTIGLTPEQKEEIMTWIKEGYRPDLISVRSLRQTNTSYIPHLERLQRSVLTHEPCLSLDMTLNHQKERVVLYMVCYLTFDISNEEFGTIYVVFNTKNKNRPITDGSIKMNPLNHLPKTTGNEIFRPLECPVNCGKNGMVKMTVQQNIPVVTQPSFWSRDICTNTYEFKNQLEESITRYVNSLHVDDDVVKYANCVIFSENVEIDKTIYFENNQNTPSRNNTIGRIFMELEKKYKVDICIKFKRGYKKNQEINTKRIDTISWCMKNNK